MKSKLLKCWLLISVASIVPYVTANPNAGNRCAISVPVNERALVSLALACAPIIQAQHAELSAKGQLVNAAGRFAEPKLSIAVAPESYTSDQIDEGYQIELSQALHWPSERKLDSSLAEATVRKSQAQLNRERINIARRVRQAYTQWVYTRSILGESKSHLTLMEQITKQLEAGYRSGDTALSALLRSQQQVLVLKQKLADLNKQQQRTEIALVSLTGMENSVAKMKAVSSPGLMFLNPDSRYLNAGLARLNQHPAIANLLANQSEVSNRLVQEKIDRRPDVTLMARHNTLWDNEDKRWMVGVAMNLPLDFSKRRAREDSLTARADALKWQQRDRQLQLQSTLRQYFLRWQEHFERGELYEERLLPMANEQLEASLADFRAGAIDFQSLLIAQQEYLQTREGHHTTMRDLRLSRAEFIAASGSVFLQELEVTNTVPETIETMEFVR